MSQYARFTCLLNVQIVNRHLFTYSTLSQIYSGS